MDMIVPARAKRAMNAEEKRVRKWILDNRGVLTRIAAAQSVSPQFVQSVAYGRGTARPGHPVERELRAAGWPAPRRARVVQQ